jgi:hypothetical protein
MFIIVILLFVLLIILHLITKKNKIENFIDTTLVQSFKIRIGVWYDKYYDKMFEFVVKISTFIPVEIIKYNNQYQPFYELKRRNVDFIYVSEKDYYIYWLNQKNKKPRLIDSLKRKSDIQLITIGFYQYVFILADYKKIITDKNIDGSVVAISSKKTLGHDYQIELMDKFKTHLIYRSEDLKESFDKLCNGIDIMFSVNEHPNKQILEYSNEKEIYLLDIDKFNPSTDYYDKYVFLNKKKINLKYYPKIYERYNSINRLGSLLIDTSPLMSTYGIKTMLLGLDTLSPEYVFEFMKVYYNNIFDLISKNIYFNNFTELDISASRLTNENSILNVHEGARRFYTKTGNYTRNPNRDCALLRNECTSDQLAKYGDYIQNQY